MEMGRLACADAGLCADIEPPRGRTEADADAVRGLLAVPDAKMFGLESYRGSPPVFVTVVATRPASS